MGFHKRFKKKWIKPRQRNRDFFFRVIRHNNATILVLNGGSIVPHCAHAHSAEVLVKRKNVPTEGFYFEDVVGCSSSIRGHNNLAADEYSPPAHLLEGFVHYTTHCWGRSQPAWVDWTIYDITGGLFPEVRLAGNTKGWSLTSYTAFKTLCLRNLPGSQNPRSKHEVSAHWCDMDPSDCWTEILL